MKYFFEHFDNGRCIEKPARITTDASISQFSERQGGLKVLLINPPIREWSYPNIEPLGLAYIASVIVMDGHKLSVLDLNALRAKPITDSIMYEKQMFELIEKTMLEVCPDVVGIGGIITQYSKIKKILKFCKNIKSDCVTILGGGISSCMPDFMVRYLDVDIAVREEGEITISEVLSRLEHNQSLVGCEGTTVKNADSIIDNGLRTSLLNGDDGLNNLPWPLRSKFHFEDIYRKNPVGHINFKQKWLHGKPDENTPFSMSMIASRGCPYSCDYCYAQYLGTRYRLRTPKDVVDEMQYAKEAYNAEYIHFLDDLFMTSYKWTIDFCSELKDRKEKTGFEIEWGCTCRTNIIADDVLRAKKEGRKNILEMGFETGMRNAGYGIETASPTILKNIDKSGQTPEKIRIAVEETRRLFGYIDPSFMIGSPGETRETIKETVDFCKTNKIDVEVIFFTTAYPATPFWQLALDKGLIGKAVTGNKSKADDDIIEKYFMMLGEQGDIVRTNFSDELSDTELEDLTNLAISELSAGNTIKHTYIHPHTGEAQIKTQKKNARGASFANI